MATRLTAIFDLVDNISAKLDNIASSGSSTISQWNSAEAAANSAFSSMERGGQQTAQACSGVATAAQSAGDAMTSSADAAKTQEDMFVLCEEAARALTQGMDASVSIQEELEAAMENATGSTEEAEEAMRELEAAQEEAAAAMDYYDAVLISGTDDLDELEGAAERAMHAAERLAEANGKAADATEELGKQSEDTGQKGVDAFEAIGNTLIGAAIAKTLKDAAQAAYELTEAFSEAESTIVLATGASGEALDSLTASMTRVYAASKTGSLNDVAAGIGEINTRLGYTDEKLEETTALFVDFTAVTGGQVAGNVRNVTQLMNQWNVGAENLESTLDKLTYSGQVSGISVETLSSQLTSNKAILDELGFSLDESIAMFSKFELNGTQAASVMTGFRTAISNGTISSLEDLYDIFERIASGEISAADAGDIFGARAGTTIVNAVRNGTFALDDMVTALENTQGTTTATAEAAQTLGQQWEQAANNISAAFTSQIEPVASRLSSGLASMANSVGTFLNRHPTVTKALTAAGVAIGVVAAGIAAVTFATTVAIPAITSFGASVNAALGPIGWITLGITAVVAAGTSLGMMMSDASESVNEFTATTQDQYDALADLQSQYEAACDKYDETSSEASLLRSQIDDLSSSIDQNGKTIQQLADECDAVINKHNELMESFNSAGDAANEEELDNLALIAKLEQLAAQTEITEGSQAAMVGIIDQLNSSIDGLNITYDDLINNQETTVATMREAAEAMAEQARQQAELENYIALIQQRSEEEAKLAEVTAEVEAAQRRADEAQEAYKQHMAEINEMDPTGMLAMGEAYGSYGQAVEDANRALELAQQEQNELTAAMGETDAAIASIEEKWGDAIDAQNDAAEAAMSYEEAVAIAYASVEAQLEDLCIAYTDAYNAALDSFSGQFGLFDEAKANMEASVESAQAALDSQLAYWDSYGKNIEYLKNTSASDLGITQENYELLMSYVQSGSEEAAGLAYNMVAEIQNGNEEAVANLATTAGEVAARQQEVAASTADWQTNFNSTMADLVATMNQTVDDLNLDGEASDAAHATIEAYAQSIADSQSSAVTAAQNIANAVTAVLQAANATITVTVRQNGSVAIGGLPAGHAAGTTDAEDVFVAGEEGPELIVGKPHSTVFPADETQKIINAVDSVHEPEQTQVTTAVPLVELGESYSATDAAQEPSREPYRPPEFYAAPSQGEAGETFSTGDGGGESVRRVVIELDGIGSIELTGATGATRDDIAEVVVDRLKPALVQILTEEVFEEGDGSYEY